MLDLIGQLYDAALDEGLWSGLAPRIARSFGSTSAQLHVRDTRQGRITRLATTANYTSAAIARHATHFAQRDIWVKRATQLGMSRVPPSKDLVADSEFERSEFDYDYVIYIGIFYVVVTVFRIGSNGLAVFGAHRPRSGGNYDEQEKGAVTRFLPHLRRALQLRDHFADPAIEHGAALAGLERSGTATLVVRGDGYLLYANTLAERILRKGDAVRAIAGHVATNDRTAAEP